MQTLLLKIIDDKAYLSEEKILSLIQIGLPEWIEKFYQIACWKIKVTKYNEAEKKLHVEIVDYDHPENTFPDSQVSFINQNFINQISFRTLDTVLLLAYAKLFISSTCSRPCLTGSICG